MVWCVHSFQLQALHPLTAGEEISISYGAIKPNHELLRDYGFFIPGNPCDRVRFIGIAGLSSTGSSDDSSAESSRSSLDGMDGVPRLNPVTLMEVRCRWLLLLCLAEFSRSAYQQATLYHPIASVLV